MEDSITLSEFEALLKERAAVDEEVKRIKKEVLAPKQEQLDKIEERVLATLEQHEMKSYRSAIGTATRATRYSVPVPKTPAEKEAYFTWLRNRSEDTYWDQLSVHSGKLTAFYQEEAAAVRGTDAAADFSIPGLSGIKASNYLSWRSK